MRNTNEAAPPPYAETYQDSAAMGPSSSGGGGLYARHADDLTNMRHPQAPPTVTPPTMAGQNGSTEHCHDWQPELEHLRTLGIHNATLLLLFMEQLGECFLSNMRSRSTYGPSQHYTNSNSNSNNYGSRMGNAMHHISCGTGTAGELCDGFRRIVGAIFFFAIFGLRATLWAGIGIYLVNSACTKAGEVPRPMIRKISKACGKAAKIAIVTGVVTGSSTLFWGGVVAGVMYGVARSGCFGDSSGNRSQGQQEQQCTCTPESCSVRGFRS